MKSYYHKNKAVIYLFLASIILIFAMLQSNELWTMESRWATVVWLMLKNHDYLHPYLFNGIYFDKPLLSYWFILAFAKLFGELNEWTLRLPSALAGIGSIYCIYRLGTRLFNKTTGIIAGWLLITCFFFVFWARIASSDMLTLFGILLSLMWYFGHKEDSRLSSYFIFFFIVALTSLCKGLMGFAIPAMGVTLDLTLNHKWKQHINWKSATALFLAILIYLAPFVLSALTTSAKLSLNSQFFTASGLYAVFQENIKRFFLPFDHQNPWYTYLIYFPLYLLPWTIFIFFAIKFYFTKWRKKTIDNNQQWLVMFIILLVGFFTTSGSRRGYYILPVVPFAILMIADWMHNFYLQNQNVAKKQYIFSTSIFKTLAITFYLLLFCYFAILQPIINAKTFGMKQFAAKTNKEIAHSALAKTLNKSEILVLNSNDNSLIFYLKPSFAQTIKTVSLTQLKNDIKIKTHSSATSLQTLPIIIATKQDLPFLQRLFANKNYYKNFIAEGNSEKDAVILLP